MSAREELSEIYLEWHALSQAEHEAIRSFDWDRLGQLQQNKEGLQRRIQAIEQRLDGSRLAGQTSADLHRNHFQSILQELVGLEAENHRQLEACLAAARQQHNQLRQSSQNLRRLHRAYVNDPSCVWQSYS